ncbi:PucR family transcriptional regulator [Spirillospora sp. NPDC127200]
MRRVAAGIAARCEGQVNRLARELAERRFAVLPDYADLPGDMRDLEIAGTARYAIRQFLQAAMGAPADPGDLRPFRERAAQRAEEGVDLAVLLRTYHIGAEVVWDALCAAARPGEEAALRWLARAQLRGLGRVVEAVTGAYQAERAAILAERREAFREVARALLVGEGAGATAARFGVPLAPAYLVLNLRLPDGPGAAVAERRVLRRVRVRLEGFAEGTPLTLLDERGGHVLLPISAADRLAELAPLLTDPASAERVVVGAARSQGTADVPRAAEQAARIARIAQSTGRPPGLYELRDVLLDYHLSGSPDSARAVAGLLDPLDGRPELLETLRAFLDHDLDRRRTARALGVHANTVDNRLARAAALLGVDPRTTRGTVLCAAALTLRQIR